MKTIEELVREREPEVGRIRRERDEDPLTSEQLVAGIWKLVEFGIRLALDPSCARDA